MKPNRAHKISLLAFDLDGTLLTSAGQLCPAAVAKLRALQDKGVKVTICSGRMPYSLKRYCQQLGLDGPIVAGNGALVVHSRSDQAYYADPVPKQTVDELLQVLRGLGLHVNLQAQDSVYFSPEYLEQDTPEQLGELYGLPLTRIRFLEKDYIFDGAEPVYKATVRIPAGKDFGPVEQYLKSHRALALSFSGANFAEINNLGTNKGGGLEKVADYYSIPLAAVCAFGDYDNDIPCFEQAGVSVAMGNASAALKARATYVTAANDDQGIAKALDTLGPSDCVNKGTFFPACVVKFS